MEGTESMNLIKLPLEDRNETAILQSKWTENTSTCHLYYQEKIWKAEVTGSIIQSFTSRLSMEAEEYLGHLKDSFINTTGFKYNIDAGILKISRILDSDFEVQFIEIPFEQVTNLSTQNEFIGNLLQNNLSLSCELNKVQKEKAIVDEELQKIAENMGILVQKKNEMEEELYTKFLLLLNEKKRKIAELMNVKYEEETLDDAAEPVEVKQEMSKQPTSTFEQLFDEDEPMKNLKIPKRTRCEHNEAGPSTR